MLNKQEILNIAAEEFAKSTKNNFAALGFAGEKIWDQMIGGFSAGDDPLYAFFKQDIGDFFWSPAEAFLKGFPDAQVSDGDLTVLSLGFAEDTVTRELQAEQHFMPNFRWLYARNSWEPIIAEITDGIVARLAEAGIRAAVIDTLPGFAWQDSEKYGFASNWSHRHAAYVCGLGTFGLCDGLITRIGKAMRFTTLLLEARLPADERPYQDAHEWCLYFKDGSCRKCMKACPAGAVSPAGHDKSKCMAYITELKNAYKHSRPIVLPGPFGCGLCQGNVPCQKGVPDKE